VIEKAKMLRSMTGFGAGRATVGDEHLAVEIRSVNHKFCEVRARLPREFALLEAALVKAVKRRMARGVIEVTVHRGIGGEGGMVPNLDLRLALEYARAFERLAADMGLHEPLPARAIFEAEGVITLQERAPDFGAAERALAQALDDALSQISAMREQEGHALQADLEARLVTLLKLVEEIEQAAGPMLIEQRDRLKLRVTELLGGAAIDPGRMAQEIALLAERTDIAEELTRMRSHVVQFRQLIDDVAPIGRRLDFLSQELHREATTVGNKAQSAVIAQRVVALKAEAERIREQVQNVE
jgi:uncharacterized protein (TIGR00255 family)